MLVDLLGKLGKMRVTRDETKLDRFFAPKNPVKANFIEIVIAVFEMSKHSNIARLIVYNII